jgi:hypothetical protein
MLSRKYHIFKRRKIKRKQIFTELRELVEDRLMDAAPYIVRDVIRLLKKKGAIYVSKNKKKNRKKTQKKKKR